MAIPWLVNGDDPNYFLTGMILQVVILLWIFGVIWRFGSHGDFHIDLTFIKTTAFSRKNGAGPN